MEGPGGYDAHDFEHPEQLLELFFCTICQGVARDLVETKCGHVYCETCLQAWTNTRNECPVDRQRLDSEHSVYPVFSARRFISQMKVKCPNRDVGCTTELSVQQLEYHVDFECIHQKTTYKTLADFEDESSYGSYLQRVLRYGMLVTCARSSEKVEKGDYGMFLKFQSGELPVQVRWSTFGHRRWLRYRDIELCIDRELKRSLGEQIEHENRLKERLQPGMKVMATCAFQSTPQGDVGVFVKRNNKYPPIQVHWESLGRNSWVVWNTLTIIDGMSAEEIQQLRRSTHPMKNQRLAVFEEERLALLAGDEGGVEEEKHQFQRLVDFDSEVEYADYLKRVLKKGSSMVRATSPYAKVLEGDVGMYLQHNSSYPPCQVRWKDFGHARWFFWRDLQVAEDCKEERQLLEDELKHETYLKKHLRKGSKVMAVHSYLSVPQGATGEFIEQNDKYPPCKVRWDFHGKDLWVLWKDLYDITNLNEDQIQQIRRQHSRRLLQERSLARTLPSLEMSAADSNDSQLQLSTRSKSESSKHFLEFADFDSELEYAEYLMKNLGEGSWLEAVRGDERVHAGDIGLFMNFNYSYPPCQVYWKDFGHTRWFYWRDLRLVASPGPTVEQELLREMKHSQRLKRSLVKGSKVIAKRSYLAVPQGSIGEFVESNDNFPPCKVVWPELDGKSQWMVWSDLELLTGDETEEEISSIRRSHLVEMFDDSHTLSANMTTVMDFDSEFSFMQHIKQLVEQGETPVFESLEEQAQFRRGDVGMFCEYNGDYPPCKVRWRDLGHYRWSYWRDLGIVKDDSEIRASLCQTMEEEKTLEESCSAGTLVMAVSSFGTVYQGQLGVFVEYDEEDFPPCSIKWKGSEEVEGALWRDITNVQGKSSQEIQELRKSCRPAYLVDFDSEIELATCFKDSLEIGCYLQCVSGDDIGVLLEKTSTALVRWLEAGRAIPYRWTDLEVAEPSEQQKGTLSRDQKNEEVLRSIVQEHGQVEVVCLRDLEECKVGETGEILEIDLGKSLADPCFVRWNKNPSRPVLVPWNSVSVSINNKGQLDTKKTAGKSPLSKRVRLFGSN